MALKTILVSFFLVSIGCILQVSGNDPQIGNSEPTRDIKSLEEELNRVKADNREDLSKYDKSPIIQLCQNHKLPPKYQQQLESIVKEVDKQRRRADLYDNQQDINLKIEAQRDLQSILDSAKFNLHLIEREYDVYKGQKQNKLDTTPHETKSQQSLTGSSQGNNPANGNDKLVINKAALKRELEILKNENHLYSQRYEKNDLVIVYKTKPMPPFFKQRIDSHVKKVKASRTAAEEQDKSQSDIAEKIKKQQDLLIDLKDALSALSQIQKELDEHKAQKQNNQNKPNTTPHGTKPQQSLPGPSQVTGNQQKNQNIKPNLSPQHSVTGSQISLVGSNQGQNQGGFKNFMKKCMNKHERNCTP